MAGVVQFPDTRLATTSTTGTSTVETNSAITQLVAASARPIRRITLSGEIVCKETDYHKVELMYGPGGSETTIDTFYAYLFLFNLNATDRPNTTFYLSKELSLPAGTRVAWKCSKSSAITASEFNCGYSVEME